MILVPLLHSSCMSQDKDLDQKLTSLLDETVPFVYQDSLSKWLEEENAPVIIDTRSPEEYKVSHIPGAIFINYNKFNKRMVDSIDRKQPVVVYCSVGYRSEKIGEKLQAMGFTEVYNLYGGIFDWKNNDRKVVNSSGATDSVHTYNKNWSKWLKKGIKVY